MTEWMSDHKLLEFQDMLIEREKSAATVEKYLRDARTFLRYLPAGEQPGRRQLAAYKEWLAERYAVSSVNSMLSSLNAYLGFLGRPERVRPLKVQRRIFCAKESELSKEDYAALIREAKQQNKRRLAALIETLCATGIRVSELAFITVEAAAAGQARVNCKGKNRVIFLPRKLCGHLLCYARSAGVRAGKIFVTKSGRSLDRSNIWKEMKRLSRLAAVSGKKVFPHNLRHLFARTFYRQQKDIARLADLLGHTSINTTRIYLMTSGEEQERQIASLGLVL